MAKLGIIKCHCIPWYMHYLNVSAKVCILHEFTCFEDIVSNVTLQKSILNRILPNCNFIKYTSFILKEEKFIPEKFDYEEIKADGLGTFTEGIYDYHKHPYRTIVQINFASPHATLITQDAKVTFSDQLGTIGGTFGVFIGASFVTLLDKIIEFMNSVYNKMKRGGK